MKLLRITVSGLPLLKKPLDIVFYASQRVAEDDKLTLFNLSQSPSIFLSLTNAFIGINASGKTSIMKVIELSMAILKCEPLNHVASKTILGDSQRAVFDIYFYSLDNQICCLETEISAEKLKSGGFKYSIKSEKLWKKNLSSVKSKKALTSFANIEPFSQRKNNEAYLPDDVSIIIAYNRETGDTINAFSLLTYTNINILPFSDDIPIDVIKFLDPTVEKLQFEVKNEKTFIHLKFFGKDEIVLNRPEDLEIYLSSGTIKGIITFSMMKDALKSGGYLLIDEIENHFNKEIVATILRFFMDSELNKKGSVLIFTTHYPELLDEYDRNDSIYIVRNRDGITAERLSNILNRNDIKKSEAYQSGYLEGTTPLYEAYIALRKSI